MSGYVGYTTPVPEGDGEDRCAARVAKEMERAEGHTSALFFRPEPQNISLNILLGQPSDMSGAPDERSPKNVGKSGAVGLARYLFRLFLLLFIGIAGLTMGGSDADAQSVSADPFAQPLRFPGQYADAETGLFDNWHRTYDPSIGRYLTPDPIGLAGGLNLFGG